MIRRLIQHAILAGVLAMGTGVAHASQVHRVRVTYYTDRGVTYSGGTTFEGVAACSWGFELGTRLRFTEDGREVVCLDRGMLGQGRGWVDIWAESAAEGQRISRMYGDYTTVEVVQ